MRLDSRPRTNRTGVAVLASTLALAGVTGLVATAEPARAANADYCDNPDLSPPRGTPDITCTFEVLFDEGEAPVFAYQQVTVPSNTSSVRARVTGGGGGAGPCRGVGCTTPAGGAGGVVSGRLGVGVGDDLYVWVGGGGDGGVLGRGEEACGGGTGGVGGVGYGGDGGDVQEDGGCAGGGGGGASFVTASATAPDAEDRDVLIAAGGGGGGGGSSTGTRGTPGGAGGRPPDADSADPPDGRDGGNSTACPADCSGKGAAVTGTGSGGVDAHPPGSADPGDSARGGDATDVTGFDAGGGGGGGYFGGGAGGDDGHGGGGGSGFAPPAAFPPFFPFSTAGTTAGPAFRPASVTTENGDDGAPGSVEIVFRIRNRSSGGSNQDPDEPTAPTDPNGPNVAGGPNARSARATCRPGDADSCKLEIGGKDSKFFVRGLGGSKRAVLRARLNGGSEPRCPGYTPTSRDWARIRFENPDAGFDWRKKVRITSKHWKSERKAKAERDAVQICFEAPYRFMVRRGYQTAFKDGHFLGVLPGCSETLRRNARALGYAAPCIHDRRIEERSDRYTVVIVARIPGNRLDPKPRT